MRLSDHALPRPGSPGPRPVASLGLPGRLATGLGLGKQDKGRGSRAKKVQGRVAPGQPLQPAEQPRI